MEKGAIITAIDVGTSKVCTLTAQVEGIGTVANGHDLIAFLLEEHDVALELLNLVVYPK